MKRFELPSLPKQQIIVSQKLRQLSLAAAMVDYAVERGQGLREFKQELRKVRKQVKKDLSEWPIGKP